MRIERDRKHDLLYIELHAGEVEETIDLAEGVHADVDIAGRVLGIEFLSLKTFEDYIEAAGGEVEIPEWMNGSNNEPSTSVLPSLPSYGDLNVEEVSRKLDSLTVDELKRVRDYERRNKNRDIIIAQIDSKLSRSSTG